MSALMEPHSEYRNVKFLATLNIWKSIVTTDKGLPVNAGLTT